MMRKGKVEREKWGRVERKNGIKMGGETEKKQKKDREVEKRDREEVKT